MSSENSFENQVNDRLGGLQISEDNLSSEKKTKQSSEHSTTESKEAVDTQNGLDAAALADRLSGEEKVDGKNERDSREEEEGSDDDDLQLSLSTMAALNEFLSEQKEKQEKLKQIEEGNIPDSFEENWNLSQFWYSSATASALAKECLRAAGPKGSIVCISSPTLYIALSKMEHDCQVTLFEFDTRFAVYKENFVLYDFRSPLDVPRWCYSNYDVVVADPPYLEESCLSRVAQTVKLVARDAARLVLCTGKVMAPLASSLLGLRLQAFAITHEKERLSNPFGCFANYDLDQHCK